MKRIHIGCAIAVAVFLLACKKETPYDFTDSKENVVIYMPQAANNAGFANIVVPKSFPGQADTTIIANFGAYYGGYDNSIENITVEFEKDFSKLDSLNAIESSNNRPPYELLPDSVFQLSGLSTIIETNTHSSDVLKLNIPNKKIEPGHKYILPITLKSASGGYQIKSSLKTTYFVVKVLEAKIEGSYTSNGYFYHPSGPRAISNRAKTITKVGDNKYKVELGDLGGSNYYAELSFDTEGKLTIAAAAGAAGAPYTEFTSGLPTSNPGYTAQWSGSAQCNNTFDPATRTFKLRYGYMGSSGWRVTEEFLKQN